MADAQNPIRITYAVLLSIGDGKSVGTGFRILLEDRVYLVTARHVLYDRDKLYGDTLIMTSYGGDDLDLEPVILSIDLTKAKIIEDDKTDTAVLFFGERKINSSTNKKEVEVDDCIDVIQWGVRKGRNISKNTTKTLSSIEAGSTVFLIGYPTSLGMIQNEYYDFRKPLLRKGSIAGLDTKKGTFVIDCPSYPGNSGGPVVERCQDGKFRMIGFVSRYIPFETKWYSNRERVHNTEISNSGYTVCVAMDAVLELASRLAP